MTNINTHRPFEDKMYEEILSEIHDEWFRGIPESAARQIKLSAPDLTPYRIVDLGCGSGVLLKSLINDCSTIHGFDISESMIGRCRNNVPGGCFAVGDVLEVKIPEANVVTMVGEILSYAAAGLDQSMEAVQTLFDNISKALETNGLFLLDFLGDRHDYTGNFLHEHSDFTIFAKVSARDEIVTREIYSFKRSDNSFEKSVETHRLRMFDETVVSRMLEKSGFSVSRLGGYAQEAVLPGRIAFDCRKIV